MESMNDAVMIDKRSRRTVLTIIKHGTVYRNNVEKFVILRLKGGATFEPHSPQHCLSVGRGRWCKMVLGREAVRCDTKKYQGLRND